MQRREEQLLITAELALDALALSRAMIDGDFQESRFRTRLIATRAPAAGMKDVAQAAADVIALLGPAGTLPLPGCGQAIAQLAASLDDAQLRLLSGSA